MSYYLNLHQGAGALLKMSNEEMVMCYSLVLPPAGLRAAYFPVNALSTFPFYP